MLKLLYTFILLIVSSLCYSQTNFYMRTESDTIGVNNNSITIKDVFCEFFWEENDNFLPPYKVTHILTEESEYGRDTICSYTTYQHKVAINRMSYGKSIVYIEAFNKNTGKREVADFVIINKRSLAWLWPVINSLLLATIILLFFVVRKRKKHAVEEIFEKTAEKHTKKYNSATILFSDIQGFTKIAAHMNPDQLVDELDRYFIFFDELVGEFGVEKIKTIGDAYMCAAGVPEADSAHAIEVTMVGLGMIDYVRRRRSDDNAFWNIRVGINTGPVVSGNLGNKKRVFDIWGDAVNTASRMETASDAGCVNISANTYWKICEFFEFEHRGKMPVKYMGEIDMYFVKRLKPMYAKEGSIYRPNELMIAKIQQHKVADLEADIKQFFFQEPSQKLMGTAFERSVIFAETLMRQENLNDYDIVTCKIACMMSFLMLIYPKTYREFLPTLEKDLNRINVSSEQRDDLSALLKHVNSDKEPQTMMEQIVHDARYEYVGRLDFGNVIVNWYENDTQMSSHRNSWIQFLEQQKEFLRNFRYYTQTARSLQHNDTLMQIETLETLETLV